MTKQEFSELLPKMREYAKRQFDKLRKNPEWTNSHSSCIAARALGETENHFGTFLAARTHGVEGFAEYGGCAYLNTGDSYTPTVYFHNGRFYAGCWANIVERHG